MQNMFHILSNLEHELRMHLNWELSSLLGNFTTKLFLLLSHCIFLSNLFGNSTTHFILLLSIACRIITNSQTFWQKLMLHILKKKSPNIILSRKRPHRKVLTMLIFCQIDKSFLKFLRYYRFSNGNIIWILLKMA